MSRLPSSHVRSLKSRLALWVLLPTVLISGVDLIFTYNSAGNVATLVQQQLLKGSAKIISEQLARIDGGYEINVPPSAFELFANRYQDRIFYSVHSQSGLLIAGDGELPVYPHPLQIEQERYFLTTLRGEPVRVIAYKHALPSTDASDYAVTQIAQTLHGHDAFRDDLLRMTIREHLILLSILALGLVIAFRWTLRPLIEFGEQLLRRQPGSLERLETLGAPVELRPIIVAMNEYASRLDRTLGAYEQFVANTAHQLRTTFAILTSQINFGRRNVGLDSTQQEVLGALHKSVAQGSKVINQLLMLAAVEQRRHEAVARAEFVLADLVQGVMEELAPLAQQKGIELGVDDGGEGELVAAPAHLVREVIANLLDNAIQHIQHGSIVAVSVQRSMTSVLLRVTDNGPGIPESEREKVFGRFYRLHQDKANSSGLGLAIVKEICDALCASVTLGTGPGGIGLQVEIAFPLASQGNVPTQHLPMPLGTLPASDPV